MHRMLLVAALCSGLVGAAGRAQAQSECGTALSALCAERLGAGAIAADDATCQRQWAEYRACIKSMAEAAASRPGAPTPLAGGCSEAQAERLWRSAERADDCIAYEGYREACPNTPEARFALAAMRRLGCGAGARPAAAAAASSPQSFAARLQAQPAGQSLKECDACPALVLAPGGAFTMGSPEDETRREIDEGPTRRVSIAPFALARDAVTVAEFRRFALASSRDMRRCHTLQGAAEFDFVGAASWERLGFAQGDDHPVVCISWEDAAAYVAWLNEQVDGAPYRLPSEAEQEYALRADRGAAMFPWGGGEHEGCRYANGADLSAVRRFSGWTGSRCDDGHVFTAPVDALPANRLGVRQLSGNVWEWAADCWNDSHAGAPKTGEARTTGDCARGVLRGGAWDGYPWNLRSADRHWIQRDLRYSTAGFRVARTLSD